MATADTGAGAAGIALATDDPSRLELHGAWLLRNVGTLARELERARLPRGPLRVDASRLTALDTAGAMLLLRALRASGEPFEVHRIEGLEAPARELLALATAKQTDATPRRERQASFHALLERTGAGVVHLWLTTRELLGFVGLTMVTLGRLLLGRRRLRLTSTVYHMEQVGLDAVPIVALLTFMVGAVVAFVGATALRDYGAEVYTVELVSVSVLREFGPLLTAILLAGRSGSAFTAQLGSMKAREELDAIRVLGLDPIELLVVPRLLALLLMLPLLTFIAGLMGILGGGVVAALSLDITPGMYISRLQEMTDVRHFWIGMIKTPVFAFVVTLVGCLEGFKVEGSAESVGRHTTASVVQSVFLVIVLDALFALLYSELEV
jgi:phospholipid/cholesterol/gamma-HCH transport system permease protein